MFEKINEKFYLDKDADREIISSKLEFLKADKYINALEKEAYFDHAQAYYKVIELAEEVKKHGGRALLVGGAVRDFVFNKISKDFDIEIYGLEAEEIESIVKKIGKVSEVGKAFGILKINLESGLDIDVSLPRIDSKINVGHKGFAVKTDANMSIKEAAKRRDFTMNALAADPLSGKIYDGYNGIEDIQNRILRITDEERFKDDPLRILRAIQFIGRFALKIEDKSLEIMKSMISDLKYLPKERIGEEWKKLLLKSEKPSIALSTAMSLGVFHELHPELVDLLNTEQDPAWHPEGNVWIHSLMVVDEAAKIVKREKLDEQKSLTVLLSALCHDLGKPAVTTVMNDHIISHGHEQAGYEPSQKFLAQLGIAGITRKKVLNLVVNHLYPTLFYIEENIRNKKITDGAIRRLAKRLAPATIQELLLLAEADHLGRGDYETKIREELLLDPKTFPVSDWLLNRARKLAVEDTVPVDITRGRDWLQFGFKAGKNIGKLIDLSNKLKYDLLISREGIFQLVEDCKTSNEAIKKMENLLEQDNKL